MSSCCGIFECSISLLRPCPTFASLGHPRSDFLLPRRPCPHTHPRVAAPFLRITSAHVFRRLLLHAAATACERCVRHMALTRVVYPALSKAGRFATASLRSRARSALRNQAQYFSIGLRSGLRGGMCHMHTLALACACLLRAVDKKLSLSHSTVQGPRRLWIEVGGAKRGVQNAIRWPPRTLP